MAHVTLMFGGNLGDVGKSFDSGLKKLDRNGFKIEKKSRVFVTAPVDCVPGTPDFWNMAVSGAWEKTPQELLQLTQQIERESGRPAEHSSREARTLDIDIITFGEMVVKEENLIIPHPRAQVRLFVLEPLFEIAPELRFPDSCQTVSALFSRVKNSE